MNEPDPPKGCLGALLGLFGIKVDVDKLLVVETIEADLYPIGGLKSQGDIAELEYMLLKSGDRIFEAEVESESGIPVGEEAVVLIHGVEVCRVTMGTGSDTEVKLRSDRGDEVPPVKVDDEAQLMYQGEVIASGIFKLKYRHSSADTVQAKT